ncbi:minor capsid protein [Human papillomavirus 144]|uniref:Minor capsid protein L2 n=1 Tax=Human papillomavirus 144 TaxID=1070417 RepID=I3P6Q0_9PAPI|nr:minor capsid protein [Human papillomavirus 144]AEM24661.1 minor capsid protein [Human papillomavirus 144]
MDAVYPRRIKRDSVDNLYKQCAITGNCPPDVKDKVEGNTLADKLLKIFSSILFFGGLGIGTGKGTGGTLGYRPLTPSTPRVLPEGTIVRPTPPIDPIGPPDIISIDAIDPAGSSIVPLQEAGGLPDSGVIEEIPLVELGQPSVVSTSDPISDISLPESTPTVVTTADDTAVAVLDISPAQPAPKRIVVEGRVKPYQLVHISSLAATAPEGADINVFVDSHFDGDVIGGQYEEIPLEDISSINPPKTSTPQGTVPRLTQRARNFYGRRVQQVPTTNVDFLSRPSRLVQFENPAFDADDITLQFEQDLEQVLAAPDTDFQDIRKLSSVSYSDVQGRVRVSRLGTRGTIQTRSGVLIGEDVHFYFDLSTIDNSGAIELQPLGEHTGDVTLVDGLAESSFIDAVDNNELDLETLLLDEQTEDFSNSHLIITGTSRQNTLSIPTIPPSVSLKIFVDDVGDNLFVSYPKSHTPSDTVFVDTPFTPLDPAILIDVASDTYYIHPSLLKKGKKRKYSDIF